jgi:mannose-6-phosphate isomerase-like protein (cupin superfamily)
VQQFSIDDRLPPDFEVLGGSGRSQAATMVLDPGTSTGGPDNRHQACDQWLLVLSGFGRAVVDGREVRLQRGSLLLIEAGEPHEIENTGREPLETLNFYAPPEY